METPTEDLETGDRPTLELLIKREFFYLILQNARMSECVLDSHADGTIAHRDQHTWEGNLNAE